LAFDTEKSHAVAQWRGVFNSGASRKKAITRGYARNFNLTTDEHRFAQMVDSVIPDTIHNYLAERWSIFLKEKDFFTNSIPPIPGFNFDKLFRQSDASLFNS